MCSWCRCLGFIHSISPQPCSSAFCLLQFPCRYGWLLLLQAPHCFMGSWLINPSTVYSTLILNFYYFVYYRTFKRCGPFFLLPMFLVVGTGELAEGLAFLEISVFSARQFLNSWMPLVHIDLLFKTRKNPAVFEVLKSSKSFFFFF